ncbi:MAG: hypothetical protein KY475_21435 [Planctomycetes bacterium]|nr:hypothetical protein [Planctomycetota bacterium]
MRFLVPDPQRVSAFGLECAHLAAPEGAPWRTAVSWSDDGALVCRRDEGDSANLFIPWRVEGRGEPMLSTTCLREQREAYHLPVELARGPLNRVRNQLETWKASGMQIPQPIRELLHEATMHFIRAAVAQDATAGGDAAQRSLEVGLNAADQLSLEYAAQLLAVRRRNGARLGTLFAGSLEGPPSQSVGKAFRAAFNSALVQPRWAEVEANTGERRWDSLDARMQWCAEKSLKVVLGPLLELSRRTTPDWLYLWEEEIDHLESYVLENVKHTVEHCQGKAHVWLAAARMNSTDSMDLSEEQRLRLTVGAIDAIRRLDPKTPVVVSFDQPWGEYLARGDWDLSPLHFADTLVRAELGVSGIGLEINWGYWPGGTPERDLLELVRLIDHWTVLNLPLLVFLSVPGGEGPDPQSADRHKAVGEAATAARQHRVIQQLAAILAAKPSVHGVIWRQVRDAAPHDFPHGGLMDHGDRPKAALNALAAFRREHLV